MQTTGCPDGLLQYSQTGDVVSAMTAAVIPPGYTVLLLPRNKLRSTSHTDQYLFHILRLWKILETGFYSAQPVSATGRE